MTGVVSIIFHFPSKKEYEYSIHCLSKLMLLMIDIQYYFENPESYDTRAPEWFIRQIKDAFHNLPDTGAEITGKLKEHQLLKENIKQLHAALERAAIDTKNLREQLVEREKHLCEALEALDDILYCPACLSHGIIPLLIGAGDEADVDFETCKCRLEAEELLKKLAFLKYPSVILSDKGGS